MNRKSLNIALLLIEYKMMNSGWSAWTEESYASILFQLEDQEIVDFINKTDHEIEEIQSDVNKFYVETVQI
jgi:hypothetical protein